MGKVDELKENMKGLFGMKGTKENLLEVIKDVGETDDKGEVINHEYRVRIYTNDYVYNISAHDLKGEEGYLGCIVHARKPRAGEKHTRSSDLADGKFSFDTWVAIMKDIIGYELVPLSDTALGLGSPMIDQTVKCEGCGAIKSECICVVSNNPPVKKKKKTTKKKGK